MIRIGIYATLLVAWTTLTVVSEMFWLVSVASGLLAVYFTLMWMVEVMEWILTPPTVLKHTLLYFSSAMVTAASALVWVNESILGSLIYGVLCIAFLAASLVQYRKWRRSRKLQT